MAKRQRKEKARSNRTKEGLRTEVLQVPQVKQIALLASPVYIRQAQGKEEKKKKLSLSLCFFWVGLPSCLQDVFSFACQIKLSVTKLQHWSAI